MDGFENLDELEKADKEDIFSKVIRAGKRTYFFDVKSTRNSDFYLTITESKKRMGKDGKMYYEKHKIFLYKEDFEKFLEGLNEVVDYIKTNQEVVPRSEFVESEEYEMATEEFSTISFEDLEK
ncbi:MAG: PUR family DNA/RNA-binding protein [Bacteroidales bacterium]|nr:PUR family DNA/RNA-binding protein [Bacteroidales bacterium]